MHLTTMWSTHGGSWELGFRGQLPISLPTQMPMDPVFIPQGIGEGPPPCSGQSVGALTSCLG